MSAGLRLDRPASSGGQVAIMAAGVEECFFSLVQECKVALGERRLSEATTCALELHEFIGQSANRAVVGAEFEEVVWDCQTKVARSLLRALREHIDAAVSAAVGAPRAVSPRADVGSLGTLGQRELEAFG